MKDMVWGAGRCEVKGPVAETAVYTDAVLRFSIAE